MNNQVNGGHISKQGDGQKMFMENHGQNMNQDQQYYMQMQQFQQFNGNN